MKKMSNQKLKALKGGAASGITFLPPHAVITPIMPHTPPSNPVILK